MTRGARRRGGRRATTSTRSVPSSRPPPRRREAPRGAHRPARAAPRLRLAAAPVGHGVAHARRRRPRVLRPDEDALRGLRRPRQLHRPRASHVRARPRPARLPLRGAVGRRHHRPRRAPHQDGRRRGALHDGRRGAGGRHRARPRRDDDATTTSCPTCAAAWPAARSSRRLGDVFGTTVNRASRLTAVAQAGSRARRRDDGPRAREPLRLRADRTAPSHPARRRARVRRRCCAARRRRSPHRLGPLTRPTPPQPTVPTKETPYAAQPAPRARRPLRASSPASSTSPRSSSTGPRRMNAVSTDMARAIAVATAEVAADETVRCVVLTSSHDKAFCVGADLKERNSFTDAELMEQRPMARAAYGGVLGLPGARDRRGRRVRARRRLRARPVVRRRRRRRRAPSSACPRSSVGVIPGRRRHAAARAPGRLVACGAGDLHRGPAAGARGARAGCRRRGACRPARPAPGRSSWPGPSRPTHPSACATRSVRCGSGPTSTSRGLEIEDGCWRATAFSGDRREGVAAFAEKRRPVWPGR